MRLTILLLFISAIAFALPPTVSKSFSLLNAGEYERAYASFHYILSRHQGNGAASFGMAKLFFMKDFSGYNLDSANYYIGNGRNGLGLIKSKWERKEELKLGYREYTVNELQQLINKEAYRIADSINTADSWNHFVSTYPSSPDVAMATIKRNTAAFNEALAKNNYASFEDFLERYPDASQVNQARYLYEKYLYQSLTIDSTWQSYKDFFTRYPASPYASMAKANYERLLYKAKTKRDRIEEYNLFAQEYPGSPYASEAEDSVYKKHTGDGLPESYVSFITKFPFNHNVNDAWTRIYRMETANYSYNTFRNFQKKYPYYPNQSQLEKDMRQSMRRFEIFEHRGLKGYIDMKSRDTLSRAIFIEAAPFSEGMAVVKLPCNISRCYYAYLNTDGKLIQTYPWTDAADFNDGKALVSIGNCSKDSCKYGFINRFGEWIIEPRYEDVFDFTEGLALVHNEMEGYGYIDKTGKEVIPLRYSDASNFNEGLAPAQINGDLYYGFINFKGEFVIPPVYTKVGSFREELAPAANEKKLWGYIDRSGVWKIEPQFEYASIFINGKARVQVRVKDPKNPKFTILNERIIDKSGKFIKG